MDSGREFLRQLRRLSRSSFHGHDARRHRSRLPHSCLFRGLHGARGRLLPLLLATSISSCSSCSTLVLANNYLLMFVGWEGVGLASYLLIGFFFLKDSAANAGKKAFITNRVGDFGFLIALFLLIQHFGTLHFGTLFSADFILTHLPVESSAGVLTAIGLLMLVGACGKSAQIPLYVWLPDAMEGPTPVSALIHAATMVTAGVYMVCRSNPIFSRAPIALLAVAIIGTLTSFFAATIGYHPDGHQARPRLLHRLSARLHVHGRRSRRLLRVHLPSHDSRLLQGLALPRRWIGDPRHRRRAGHAQDGRPPQVHAMDFLDHAHRNPRHLRHSVRSPDSSPRTRFSGRPSAVRMAAKSSGSSASSPPS